MNADSTLLHAPWVAPMDGPCIRDGAVVFAESHIVAVGENGALRRAYPDANAVELKDSVILPGLVNAHTHLELSSFACSDMRAASLAEWLVELIQRRARSSTEEGVRLGIEQCHRFGVTTVGDITRECAASRRTIGNSPLRAVSYGEVQAMAQQRELLSDRLAAAVDFGAETDRLRIGISPHAPYTVEPNAYRACLDAARRLNLPVATHLAETRDEAAFLADQSGPFRALWKSLGWWDEHVPRFSGGPIRFAKLMGLLDYPTLLAHVNYCDDGELAMLAAGRASVVYCPRTHAYFGHPPHRWRDMLAAGINVAVGTDSCASSPDLNLVDDLRLLHRIAPEVPVQVLWEMATTRAGKAIDLGGDVGSLTPGKLADFVVFPATGDDPLAEALENGRLPTHVWVNGEQLRST